MKTVAAGALIALSGLAGAAYASTAPANASIVAHFGDAGNAGSAGSNGTGDHMAGKLDNTDQVTNTGPNEDTRILQSVEKAALGS
ncbi:MAG: hypothetical protein ACRC20_10810 [Segniliparus sp.]|uniref:hypothetical protein n=1 Tax=Segniliparus sp. TaxID=2804064 RepID=UPI003F2DE2D6